MKAFDNRLQVFQTDIKSRSGGWSFSKNTKTCPQFTNRGLGARFCIYPVLKKEKLTKVFVSFTPAYFAWVSKRGVAKSPSSYFPFKPKAQKLGGKVVQLGNVTKGSKRKKKPKT